MFIIFWRTVGITSVYYWSLVWDNYASKNYFDELKVLIETLIISDVKKSKYLTIHSNDDNFLYASEDGFLKTAI